eukprot:COSAG06_NODE_1223_length_10199_cov_3.394356_3_plen_110_part_00
MVPYFGQVWQLTLCCAVSIHEGGYVEGTLRSETNAETFRSRDWDDGTKVFANPVSGEDAEDVEQQQEGEEEGGGEGGGKGGGGQNEGNVFDTDINPARDVRMYNFYEIL